MGKEIHYYAEFGTDQYIRETFFPDIENGLMVEVGAGPPEFYSMSKHFRDSGWRCICIDPNPKFVGQHKKVGNEVYQFACSNENKKSYFKIFTQNGWPENEEGISCSALEIRYAIPEEASIETIHVEVKKLDDILMDLNISHIDFVSIDVEGWELEVMQGFLKFKPSVIVIENCLQDNAYTEFMNNIGYQLIKVIEYNYIFTLG